MADYEIFRSADLRSLGELPRLTHADGEVLEQLLWLAPDVALSTAAAVVRAHQPDAAELIFGQRPEHPGMVLGQLARAIIYLGLAVAAPGQGRILPLLTREHLNDARAQVRVRVVLWHQASGINGQALVEDEAVPDPELRRLLHVLIERLIQRTGRDPLTLRAAVYAEAGALYAVLRAAARAQYGEAAMGASEALAHLERVARTRDLLTDALSTDEEQAPRFDPARQRAYVERLRRYGWEERQASQGRTLAQIAAEARAQELLPTTTFPFTDEWVSHGASQPTNGQRYFLRPTLLPDSGGLALWTQEERLKPLQKMLAGDPRETGLRLTLPSAELLLEYVVSTGARTFLEGAWSRVSNRFDGVQTRFGDVANNRYTITLFASSRLDSQVGVCPIVVVEAAGG